jgi:hypothetical protein
LFSNYSAGKRQMKRFKTYIAEGKYPVWVRVTVGALVLRIRSLSVLIQKEDDPVMQNKLIAQQNKLLSYINGLSVGVSSSDAVLLKKFKSLK